MKFSFSTLLRCSVSHKKILISHEQWKIIIIMSRRRNRCLQTLIKNHYKICEMATKIQYEDKYLWLRHLFIVTTDVTTTLRHSEHFCISVDLFFSCVLSLGRFGESVFGIFCPKSLSFFSAVIVSWTSDWWIRWKLKTSDKSWKNRAIQRCVFSSFTTRNFFLLLFRQRWMRNGKVQTFGERDFKKLHRC